LGRFFVSAKANGLELENIAILATTGRGVAKISAALNGGAKPIPHKVLFDEREQSYSSGQARQCTEGARDLPRFIACPLATD
ncbi:hypothetical protein V1979_36185, partial [Pseudomonas aeruginosa]